MHDQIMPLIKLNNSQLNVKKMNNKYFWEIKLFFQLVLVLVLAVCVQHRMCKCTVLVIVQHTKPLVIARTIAQRSMLSFFHLHTYLVYIHCCSSHYIFLYLNFILSYLSFLFLFFCIFPPIFFSFLLHYSLAVLTCNNFYP